MHILLTRPLEDSQEMIVNFSNLGHQVSHLPLLSVEPIEYDPSLIKNYKAIIFITQILNCICTCKNNSFNIFYKA